MHDKSYKNWIYLSDDAIALEIGHFVRKTRIHQHKTQNELAKAANISRSTLSLLERGESGNLKTLIQVLRVLDSLHVLQTMQFKDILSPLALAKAQHKSVKRVRKSSRKNVIQKSNASKSDW